LTLNENFKDSSMRAWIAAGASPQKLIMGLAFYGNSFTLASAANNRVGAPSIGAGAQGPYTSKYFKLLLITILMLCFTTRSAWILGIHGSRYFFITKLCFINSFYFFH
jgi:hypothetical protein